MLGDEALHIGQTAAGKMRPGDAEMVQELGEARLDRRVPDGTDGGCYGRSPYSGIGTNNARLAFRTAVARFVQSELFRDAESVIHLNPETPDEYSPVLCAEQQLHGSPVASLGVNLSRHVQLCTSGRISPAAF